MQSKSQNKELFNIINLCDILQYLIHHFLYYFNITKGDILSSIYAPQDSVLRVSCSSESPVSASLPTDNYFTGRLHLMLYLNSSRYTLILELQFLTRDWGGVRNWTPLVMGVSKVATSTSLRLYLDHKPQESKCAKGQCLVPLGSGELIGSHSTVKLIIEVNLVMIWKLALKRTVKLWQIL